MFTSSATVHSASSIHMMVGLTSPQLSTASLGSEQINEQTGDHAPKVAQMYVTGFVKSESLSGFEFVELRCM